MIKDEVLTGESVDDWYSLSGKQGDDKEGMINIMMQHKVWYYSFFWNYIIISNGWVLARVLEGRLIAEHSI